MMCDHKLVYGTGGEWQCNGCKEQFYPSSEVSNIVDEAMIMVSKVSSDILWRFHQAALRQSGSGLDKHLPDENVEEEPHTHALNAERGECDCGWTPFLRGATP